jgi:hypothetical protein
MASIWSGISDNTGVVKIWSDINVDSVSRTNNTITFNNMYVRNWTPTAGAVDSPPFYDDIYNSALTIAFIPGWSSKGTTGGSVITNINYYTAGTSPSTTVGAYDTAYYFAHRINTDGVWRAWLSPIGIGIPATTDPSLSSTSVSAIKPTQAAVTWSAYQGDYCTWTSMSIEYGLTTGYGLGNGIAASGTQTLTGLKPGKIYHYRFYMVNGAGRAAYSADYTFKTQAVAGLSPLLMEMV